jgi:DNA topoisomerase-3
MRLFVCEKPSVARSLAALLGATKRTKPNGDHFAGHLEGNGVIIASLFGHFYRLSEPHEHNPELSQWRINLLPIIINDIRWVQMDRHTGRISAEEIDEQVKHVKSLYPRVNEVCIACDAGQEGQLIGQLFVQETGWTGNVTRLWTGSLEEESLRKAVSNIKPNYHYQGLFDAACARAFSDQLVGFNFTRLFTLLSQQAGYSQKVSIGRVVSAILAIVTQSDIAHESHQRTAFYSIDGRFEADGKTIDAEMTIPSHLKDAHGYCRNTSGLESFIEDLNDKKELSVLNVSHKKEQKEIPTPFCQNTLGQYMASNFGMLPKETLSISQKLYDGGYLTYPRGDDVFYENQYLTDIALISRQAATLSAELSNAVDCMDINNPANVFDSSKVVEHTALSITQSKPNYAVLSQSEKDVYTVVAQRLFAQFAGTMEQASVSIVIGEGPYRFIAKGSTTTREGWGRIIPYEKKSNALPHLLEGDRVSIKNIEIKHKFTKAPPRMTVTSFLAALEDCTRFLSPAVKESIGTGVLGTAATQPEYLENMCGKKMLHILEGKYVVSTKQGRNLRSLTPDILSSPDMTSLWEMQFREIRAGRQSKESFLFEVKAWVTEQINISKNVRFKPSPLMEPCHVCQSALLRKESAKYKSFFYVCSSPECNTFLPDHDGRPMVLLEGNGEPCKNCGAPMETKLRKKELLLPKSKHSTNNKERRYMICTARCEKA